MNNSAIYPQAGDVNKKIPEKVMHRRLASGKAVNNLERERCAKCATVKVAADFYGFDIMHSYPQADSHLRGREGKILFFHKRCGFSILWSFRL